MTKIDKKHIELVALSDQDNGQESFRVIKLFNKNKNQYIYTLLKTSSFAKNIKIKEKLLSEGFDPKILKKNFDSIVEIILEDTERRVKLCNKPGFFTVDNELFYIKSSGEVLGENDELKILPYPDAKTFTYSCKHKGTLEEWKNNVAETAKYSPYVMLGLCSALAGMCTYYTKIESGGL